MQGLNAGPVSSTFEFVVRVLLELFNFPSRYEFVTAAVAALGEENCVGNNSD